MASLQIAAFAGAFRGADHSIPDGPPIEVVVIEAGDSGHVFGASGEPFINEFTPLGGSVAVTWPNGVTEVIVAPCARALRGEAVSVA